MSNWKPSQSFGIQTSLDNLASNFNELEGMYFSSLQKSLQEGQKILSQSTNLSSELYHNLIREQTKLETHKKKLAGIKSSYAEDLNKIRQILTQGSKESSESVADYQNGITELKGYIEFSINGAQEKIFEIDEIEYFDKTLKERIQNCFEETFQKVDSAFAEFRKIKETAMGGNNVDFKKLETIANSNLLALNGIEAAISQTKRRVVRTMAETDNCVSSYSKEAQSLIENIDQLRELIQVKQETRQSSRLASPSRNQELLNLYQSKHAIENIERSLDKLSSSDAKKNKVFNNTKGELERVCGKIKPIVKDFVKHAETLKANNQALEAIINKQNTRSESKGREISSPVLQENNEGYLQREQTSPFNLYATWSHRLNSPENLSPSPFDLQDKGQGRNKEPTVTRRMNSENNELISQYRNNYDTILQKIKHLQTTVYNFLNSCDKLSGLLKKRFSEEEFVLQVYGNDRKLFENYLNSFVLFIKDSQRNLNNPESVERNLREERHSPGHPSRRDQLREVVSQKELDDYEFKLRVRKAAASLEPNREDRMDSRALLSYLNKKEKDSRKTIPEEDQQSPERPQSKVLISNLVEKLKDVTEKCERLKKENSHLVKLSKKLEIKGSKRKNTIKQLFELVTEKEKELQYYQNTMANSQGKSKNSNRDLEEIFESRERNGQSPERKEDLRYNRSEERENELRMSLPLAVNSNQERKTQARAPAPEDEMLEQVTLQNKELEQKCQSLLQEIDLLKEQKEKMEKKQENKENEIRALSEQIKQLNEANQDLERQKETLSVLVNNQVDNRSDAPSPSPSNEREETYLKDLNNKLKSELKVIIVKLEDTLVFAGFTPDQYNPLQSDERIELLQEGFKKKNEAIKEKEDLIVKEREEFAERLAKESGEEYLTKEFNRKLNEKDKEIKSLQQKIEFKNNNMSELEQELIIIKERIKEKQRTVDAKEKELLEKNRLISELQESGKRAERKSVGNQEGSRDGEEVVFDEKPMGEVMQNTEELIFARNELEKQVKEYEAEFINMEDERAKQQTKMEGLEAELVLNKHLVEDFMLKVKLAEEEADVEKKAKKQAEKDLAVLKKRFDNENSELAERIGQLEAEAAENQRVKTQEGQDKEDEIGKLQRDLGVKNKELENKREEIGKLQEDIGEKTKELENKTQEVEKLKRDVEEKTRDLENKEEEIVEVNRRVEEAAQENKQYKARIEDLSKTNEELRGEKEILLMEKSLVNEESSQAVKEVQEKIREYESTLQEERTKIRHLEEESNELKKEKAFVVTALEMSEKTVSQLKEQVERANEGQENLKQQIKKQQSEAETREEELRGEIQGLKESVAKLEELEEELKNKEEILGDISKELERAENDLKEERKKANETREEYQERIKYLEDSAREEKERLEDDLREEKKQRQEGEESLKEENNRIIKEKEQEKKSFEEQKKNLEHEFEGLSKKIEELVKENQKLQSENEKLVSQVSGLQKELADLNENINIYKKASEENQNNNETLSAEHMILQNNYNKVSEQVKELEESLKGARSENEKLNKDLYELKSEHTELEKKYNQEVDGLKSENARIEGEKNKKIEEIDEIKRSFENTEKDLKSINDELETKYKQEVEELKKENARIEEEKNKKVEEIEEIKKSFESSEQSLKTQNAELETKHKQEIDELKKENTRIEEEKNNKVEELKKLEATLEEERKSRVEEVKNIKTSYESSGKELNTQIEELETRYSQEIKDLKKEKSHIEEEKNKKIEEINKLNTETSRIEEEKNKKILEIDGLKHSLEEEKNSRAHEVKELRASFESSEKALKDKYDELSSKHKQLDEEHTELKTKYERLVEENEKNHSEVQSLGAEIDSLRGTLKARETEIDMTKNFSANEMDVIKNKYISQIADLTVQAEVAKRSRDELEKELDAKKQDLKEERNKSERLTTERTDLEKQVKQHIEEIAQLNSRLQEAGQQKSGLEKQLEEAKAGNTDLRTQTRELNERISNLQTQEENLKKERDDLQKKVETSTEEINKLVQEGSSLKTKIEQLNEELQKKVESSTEEINKLTQEGASLKSKIEQSNQENETLKGSLAKLQEEISAFTEVKQNFAVQSEILETIKESFKNLFESTSLKETNINISFEKKEDIQKVVSTVESVLQRKEEVNAKLAADLELVHKIEASEQEFAQEQNDLRAALEEQREIFRERFIEIKEEVKIILAQISENPIEEIPILLEGDGREEVGAIVVVYFQQIKDFISYAKQIEMEYASFEERTGDMRDENENLVKMLAGVKETNMRLNQENQNLKIESNQLKEICVKKETEVEEIKKSLQTEKEKSLNRGAGFAEPSFSVHEDIDDLKVQSFMEESVKVDSRNVIRKEERMAVQEQENLKALYDQLRLLQDENERLEAENKQIQTNYEILGFAHEDLKADLQDTEEEVGKANFQLAVLKEEFGKLGKEKDLQEKNAIIHIKQQIRAIFLKFMQSVFDGNKDAIEILKPLLGLLDMNEKEKAKLLDDFKAKTAQKKGVLGKFF